MGKRKRVQKKLKQNQKQKTNQIPTPSETKFESVLPTGAEKADVVVAKEASMNDLPPEVLTDIFKFVDNPSLFVCRLVSLKWNEISSEIWSSRPKNIMSFDFHGEIFGMYRKIGLPERNLKDFLKCIKLTKNCPFARFAFEIWCKPPSRIFQNEDWIEFASAFGESEQNENLDRKTRIKYLELNFHHSETEANLKTLVENLRDLLVNKIPNIEELNLDFSNEKNISEIGLFSSSAETNTPSKSVQLPHLKVIHFDNSVLLKIPQASKDLLNAAVNLRKVNFLFGAWSKFENIQFLLSLKRPFLIQNFMFKLTEEFFNIIKQQNINLSLLKFQELWLTMDSKMYQKDPNSLSAAANFISNLLESSKNSLRKLQMASVGFLPGVKFPLFKNLVELSLRGSQIQNGSLLQMFPAGIRSLDIFPAVNSLEFVECNDLSGGFPREDSIPMLPNLTHLRLPAEILKTNNVCILNLMCPNLKHLQIFRNRWEVVFLWIGRVLWSQMKTLETLELDVNVSIPENNSLNLDSCFTGISVENCQHLCKMMEAKETLENYGATVEIPEPKLKALTEREHPSILDMKDLKKLTINAFSGRHRLTNAEFMSKLSWISEEYAFKFMPHLKPKSTE